MCCSAVPLFEGGLPREVVYELEEALEGKY